MIPFFYTFLFHSISGFPKSRLFKLRYIAITKKLGKMQNLIPLLWDETGGPAYPILQLSRLGDVTL